LADAQFVRDGAEYPITVQATVGAGELWQLPTGEAGWFDSASAASSGSRQTFKFGDVVTLNKAAAVAILDGGEVWWDYSANLATFRRVGDRDFYAGRAVGDADENASSVQCVLGKLVPWDVDLVRDGFRTAPVGTQALGGLGLTQRGGILNAVVSATNEAQKLDALGIDSFANAANWIVEGVFTVPSDGAGTVVDVSLGIASATHATDADAIAQHLFLHLDANATAIKFQSKDGTTTVTATDSTKVYVEGAALANRVHVWFDGRDPAAVKVYVNGVRVLTGTTFNVNAAASEWLPLFHVEKSLSTDAYEFDLHKLRVRFAEQ
jgi:hypothetical protein